MKRLVVLQLPAVLFVLSLMVWGFLPSNVEGAVPQLINFQGVLKDGSGNPVTDGVYSVTFTIYDAPTGGNVKWTETQSVTTSGGLFTVLLGSTTPVPDSVFYDSSRYIGIAVSPDAEMTPRQRLSSVGYSSVSSQWTSGLFKLFTLNNYVGIGTDNPYRNLMIQNNTTGAAQSDYLLTLVQRNTLQQMQDGFGGGISFVIQDIDGIGEVGMIDVRRDGDDGSGKMEFNVRQFGTLKQGIAIRSSGNVGVGTANPGAKLDVLNGNIRASSQLASAGIEFYPAVSGTPTNAGSIVGVGGSSNLAILPVGNVGIGTTTPIEKLDVDGSIAIRNSNSLKIYSDGVGLNFTNAPGAFGTLDMQKTGDLNPSVRLGHSNFPARAFTIMTGNGTGGATERITVLPTGEVGVGTTNPVNKLDVEGGMVIGATYAGANTAPANGLLVQGNVGIGTGSPSRLLHISGTTPQLELSDPGAGLDLKNRLISSSGGGLTFGKTNDAHSLNTYHMTIDTDGKVGIGTSIPTEKLHVVGNICATGTIGACSDLRFKQDVRPVENSLDKLEKLQGVTYRWNREKYPEFAEGNQIGFVAQQVKEVLPEVVSEGSDGTLSVDYGRLSVVLVEAIKEQQKEINELKAAMEKLQTARR